MVRDPGEARAGAGRLSAILKLEAQPGRATAGRRQSSTTKLSPTAVSSVALAACKDTDLARRTCPLDSAVSERPSGSVFVEPFTSSFGDREAGWLVRHPSNSAIMDQSIERIRQSTEIQAGSRGRLQLLERHTGRTMLGS